MIRTMGRPNFKYHFRNWCDGSRYKERVVDQEIPSIPIVLYYDEIDCSSSCNTPNMKMAMVYFLVATTPITLQGKLKSIHLVAVAHSDIKKKKGIGKSSIL